MKALYLSKDDPGKVSWLKNLSSKTPTYAVVLEIREFIESVTSKSDNSPTR